MTELESKSNSVKKRKFFHDLEEMMYGFGDAEFPPNAASVELVEEFVTEYIQEVTSRAVNVAELTGKLDKDCFLYVVRKDRKKFNRVHKLLNASEEIKNAQKIELHADI